MAVEKIVTLCKEGDSTTEYYPNIKADNIPVNAVAKSKLANALQDEIDGKAPQSTTYTKTEIDNKLSGKVNVATYNAKVSELETAIGTKANATDVYTKTATDTLLDAKANLSDVFTKSEINTLLQNGYYNQTEIDLMLENKADADDVYTKTATDTLLNGKQNALTTSSVNDGTIDKNIGFDSQGNIVKQTASGGGSQLYIHNISISRISGERTNDEILLKLISSSNSVINTGALLYANKDKIIECGIYFDGMSVKCPSYIDTLNASYIAIWDTYEAISIDELDTIFSIEFTNASFTDNVVTL